MKLSEFLQKHNLSEGNLVSVLTKKQQILEGNILPSGVEEILALKLKNGYNAGVKIGEVSEVKKLSEGKSVGKPPVKEIQKDPKKPTISIINTGGTIAARVDYSTGAVRWNLSPEELLSMYPSLSQFANFNAVMLRSMATDDYRFEHFELIAKAIEEEIKKGVEGIILTMGTDNLAVASAALSFIFESIPVPVIVVGSQRSSDRGSTDAEMNLTCAAKFITGTDFAGIAICMHGSSSDDYCAILPACKTKKLHTSRRDAFKPVNDTIIAKVWFQDSKIEFVKENYLRKDKHMKTIAKPKMESKIGLLKITINMFPEQFEFYGKEKFKGLIIEGTGLGHTPLEVIDDCTKIHSGIEKALKELDKSDCVMVLTSTCLFGRVGMNVYSKGVQLQELGVIPGEDMLPETAFVKLAWLLGQFPKNPEKVKELMQKNLRGEITERTGFEENFAGDF